MKNHHKPYIKRMLFYICLVAFVGVASSCSTLTLNKEEEREHGGIKLTTFELDSAYLSEQGVELPELSPTSPLKLEEFLTLLVETYEAMGGEIDLSLMNPRNETSDVIKKMTFIGTYDSYFMDEEVFDWDLDYGTAAHWLLRFQDSIQKRLYWKEDVTATTADLLRRINISTVLHTWTEDAEQHKTFTLKDLLAERTDADQPLTNLMIAEMMVSAYENTVGEIAANTTTKLNDTDDTHALKANEFFFWTETGNFEPEKMGNWNDWGFMSAINYDSQLRVGLGMDEAKTPYGAVISTLATLLRDYEKIEKTPIEEKIILNERPYDWHVNQQETGEYSAVNCMPSCVEMAIKYQGLPNVPSAEQLRKDNPMDGQGWYDVLAENVMRQYGVELTDSFELNLDKMVSELDEGNVLYVMYGEPEKEIGHSVIIKGYWKQGNELNFIISDPDYNMVGPFGYLEYLKDAETMLVNMESHVPRYFIIPPGAAN